MSLIACCNGQQVLRSTCGTPANVKANAGRLAGVPANVKANAGGLAGLPQTPKQMPGDLRDSRKRPSKCRETCGTPANAKANAGRLAGVPANVKANVGRPAGLPANAQKFFEVLATVLQAFPKTFWSGFRRNSLLALFLHRTHVVQRFLRHTCPVKTTTPGEN